MTTPIPSIPAAITDITPEWLTQVWRHLGHEAAVAGLNSRRIGTGQTALSQRLVIDYAQRNEGLPESLIAKLIHPEPASRTAGQQMGSYAREYGFYTTILPTVRVPAPRCWHAAIDVETADFVLLLEDMAPAQQGDQIAGCDETTARRAVEAIAGLHAPRWGDATLREYRFLAGVGEGIGDPSSVPPEQFAQFWQAFLGRYGERLGADIVGVGEGLARHFGNWARPYPGPRTITHGDFRLDNILIDHANAARPITVVDWQTAGHGCGTSDVAYFLGAGLLPETRRRHERDLLRAYHEALRAGGVRDYGFEQLWRDYSWYSYSGFVMAVVASVVVAQTERGDEMFMAMAQRHGQHALDLGAEQLIAAA